LLMSVSSTAPLHPVILVPGLAGSVFRVKLDGAAAPHVWCEKESKDFFITWLNVEELVPLQKDCTLSRLMPYYNATTRTYHDAPGVTLDTNVDMGGVGGVEYLDPSLKATKYFATMIRNLTVGRGYVVGTNLHGAPYDWRAAPDGHSAPGAYYDKLRTLIESTVTANGNRAAHIVSHSLGGPTILFFLARQTDAWRTRYIRSFVPISAPWGGAARMAYSDVSGDNFDIPLVPHDYLKPVQAASASGNFLLPSVAAFGHAAVVVTPSRNYSASDWPAMLATLGLSQAADIYAALTDAHMLLDDLPTPGVTTHIVSSLGVNTPERFHYKTDFVAGTVFVGRAVGIRT